MKRTPTDLELIEQQVETLFLQDEAKRLLAVNEPDKPEAPRFFLGRTKQGNLYRFRRDQPRPLIKHLEALVISEPVPQSLREEPVQLTAFADVLREYRAIRQVWTGPAYTFSGEVRWPSGVVSITDTNADLLGKGFADLKAGLTTRQPCVAVVRENRVVSVCCSARTSPRAAEAGLETLEAFRGRGYAAAAVAGWAAAVRKDGRTPLYSTSWDNLASQGVAKKLGLTMYGADFHVT